MNFFNNNHLIIDISWQSIFRVLLVLFILFFIWYFRQLLLLILVAFIIALLLETPINFFNRKFKKRGISITLTYLIVLGSLAGLIYFSIPLFLNALETAITRFNILVDYTSIIQFLEKINLNKLNNNDLITILFPSKNSKNLIGQTVINYFNLLSRFSGGAFSLFFVIILTIFFNIESKSIESFVRFLAPAEYERYTVYLLKRVKIKIDQWFYSQLILSILVGILLFAGLKILGIYNALFLSLLAAILDFIPYLGPAVAGFVTAMFAFSQSEDLILSVSAIILFSLIQFIENVIAPIIRARSLELNPLLIIIAIVIGEKIAGALGVIIALPVSAILIEFLKDLHDGKIEQFKIQKELI